MKRCQSCNYENAATSMYCERCGFLLDASSIEYTVPAQSIYNTINEEVPPPPPLSTPAVYARGVENNYYTPSQMGANQMNGPAYAYAPTHYASNAANYAAPATAPRRTIGGSILSSILYLWGLFWAVLGFFGLCSADLNEGFLGLIISVGLLLGLVILVLLLVFYKHPRLKMLWRTFGALGMTVLGFFALFIGESLLMAHRYPQPLSDHMQNYYLGLPLGIYGLAMAVIAFI